MKKKDLKVVHDMALRLYRKMSNTICDRCDGGMCDTFSACILLDVDTVITDTEIEINNRGKK